jgi:predicted NBD/HSP70 family sugar kinase
VALVSSGTGIDVGATKIAVALIDRTTGTVRRSKSFPTSRVRRRGHAPVGAA